MDLAQGSGRALRKSPVARAGMRWKSTATFAAAVIIAGACSHSENVTGTDDSPASNHSPVAKVEGPMSAVEGAAVTFKADGSTDPDHDALTYSWKFGDTSGLDSGASVSHTYLDNGSRAVAVI